MDQLSLFTLQELQPDTPLIHGMDPMLWLVDVPKFRAENLPQHQLPDASEFAKEALCTRPGMEWLAQVETILIAPFAGPDDPDSQWAQLVEFTATLQAEARWIIPKEAFPGIADYVPTALLAVDTETTGLDLRVRYNAAGQLDTRTKLVGVTVAPSARLGYYLPVRNTGADDVLNWHAGVIAHWLGVINTVFLTAYHNAGYDFEVEALNGVSQFRPYPYFVDTQVADYIHDPNSKTHGLKGCAARHLGRHMIEIAELFVGMGGIKKNAIIMFEDLSASQAFVYACSDSINTFALVEWYYSQSVANIFTEQSIPMHIDQALVNTVRSMVRPGLPMNYAYYWFAAKDALYRQHLLEQAIYAEVGRIFTIGSQPQLNEVLFDQYGIPPTPEMEHERNERIETMRLENKLKEGQRIYYSCAEEVLDKLFQQHPDYKILNYVVTYRKLVGVISKVYLKALANTYVDSWLPWARVNLSFSQTTAATGRLSSSSSDGKERVTVSRAAQIGYKYERGSWDAGMNSQGFASGTLRTARARVVSALPPGAGLDVATPYPEHIEQAFIKGLARL